MPKRILQGVCVSDKQDKTVVVTVERRYTHPQLRKTVRSRKKYYAHDETNSVKTGDQVRIVEARPMSKLKRWVVVTDEAQGGAKSGAQGGAKAAESGTKSGA